MIADSFEDIARYYDALMSHVDYNRWYMVTTTLANLVDPPLSHLDAACGTGVLAKRLLKDAWNTTAIDLSPAMVAIARKKDPKAPVAIADLRAIPFTHSFSLITCLFDSVNFLLTFNDVEQALSQCAAALRNSGILYFDIVTERMVTEYFEGQEWLEDNATFSSRWRSTYDRTTRIAETRIRVNRGQESLVRERIYALGDIKDALECAGLTMLGAYDARTWRAPGARTVRIDIIAALRPTPDIRKRCNAIENQIRTRIRDMDY